ncbi:MAG: DUF4258 domain-containing protein [Candidatus Binatia bacterium]|nr:DUF4258 domain-containing protein [Candidatus Binatia bacterium]
MDASRAKVASGKYLVAFTHTEKLRRRRIRAQDIEEAVRVGAVIEDYPDDLRGASCLILGMVGRRPLHVVCGCLDAEEILIVTAYEPDPREWENDWKTRKKKI